MTGGSGSAGEEAALDRLLAPALEFAVGVAAVWAKRRPAVPFPSELRRLVHSVAKGLTPAALATARRAVDQDPVFRSRLGSVADAGLVGEIGVLWLQRPDGWEERVAALVAASAAADAEQAAVVHAAVRAADRRRDAAERAQARALAELAAVRAEADAAQARVAELTAAAAEVDALRAELEAVRAELRAMRDRWRAVTGRVEQAIAERDAADARAAEAEQRRDAALADRAAAWDPRAPTAPARTAKPVRPSTGRVLRRTPIGLPGGVYGTSEEAAVHLVGTPGAVVLVDGYNVAKTGWPGLSLDHQRERCIAAAEDVVRRYGPQTAVVFDGADVPGARATGHRLVRVVFSPAGVSADDVLRAEVGALAVEIPVVVVTDDRAIVDDVRRLGANVLAAAQYLAAARHR